MLVILISDLMFQSGELAISRALCMEGSSDTSILRASCAAMARTLCCGRCSSGRCERSTTIHYVFEQISRLGKRCGGGSSWQTHPTLPR